MCKNWWKSTTICDSLVTNIQGASEKGIPKYNTTKTSKIYCLYHPYLSKNILSFQLRCCIEIVMSSESWHDWQIWHHNSGCHGEYTESLHVLLKIHYSPFEICSTMVQFNFWEQTFIIQSCDEYLWGIVKETIFINNTPGHQRRPNLMLRKLFQRVLCKYDQEYWTQDGDLCGTQWGSLRACYYITGQLVTVILFPPY